MMKENVLEQIEHFLKNHRAYDLKIAQAPSLVEEAVNEIAAILESNDEPICRIFFELTLGRLCYFEETLKQGYEYAKANINTITDENMIFDQDTLDTLIDYMNSSPLYFKIPSPENYQELDVLLQGALHIISNKPLLGERHNFWQDFISMATSQECTIEEAFNRSLTPIVMRKLTNQGFKKVDAIDGVTVMKQ